MNPAVLVLEDGRTFLGRRFGATTDVGGELVFNTAMAGYQEVLGDPSYARQIVVMTYPMQGNYGIAKEDDESSHVHVAALVVKEVSRIASSWRHQCTLDDHLKEHGVPGFCDIDTRALVRHLRDRGAMRAVIVDGDAVTPEAVAGWVEKAKQVRDMRGADLAAEVSTHKPYTWDIGSPLSNVAPVPPRYHVVVVDYGAKRNILRRLVDVGCRVTVVPASSTAAAVLAHKPCGVMLSNGPGDPEAVSYGVTMVRDLLGRVPIFGICLGHQLLALAVGGKSYKLKFGHRGVNHPVIDVTTNKVEITSQNHGFCIDPLSLPKDKAKITHINLNDKTLAGIALVDTPAFSVQYHPEAAPGPHDAGYLFTRFTDMMDAFKKRSKE